MNLRFRLGAALIATCGTSAEGTIEIGQIAESDIEAYRADAAIAKTRLAQHPVRGRKPAEDECGKGGPFTLEELVDVTRRHALAPRACGNH